MPISDADLTTVAARLAKPEGENQQLSRLVAAAVLLGLASTCLSLIHPAVAQESKSDLHTLDDFALRDAAGRVRAQLAFSDADGSPMFSLLDAEGRSRLLIWADAQSTSIVGYSPNGGRF